MEGMDFLVYDIARLGCIACATSLRMLIYQSAIVYVMKMEWTKSKMTPSWCSNI